MPLILAIC